MNIWSDLVISDNSYLTDEHRFVADVGSFQFCKDLNGELVDLDSIHTAQSTLNDLLRNREIFWARTTKNTGDSTSERLELAQDSDDELRLLEACFQAQGLTGPQAKSKTKIKKSKEASSVETREYAK